ncbi:MAG: hypothetical protein ABSC35_07230 [Candidatus Dormibacteria bacterium]|jgi:hypothetical protein
MAAAQRVVERPQNRGSRTSKITPGRFVGALLVGGAVALLATACGSSLGWNTPCSTWQSMDNADQQSTIVAINQQAGLATPNSSDFSEFQRLADDYCSDPFVNMPTIEGMLNSRPS